MNTALTNSGTFLKIHSSNLDVTRLQKVCLDYQIFKNLNSNLQKLELGSPIDALREIVGTSMLVCWTWLSKSLEKYA